MKKYTVLMISAGGVDTYHISGNSWKLEYLADRFGKVSAFKYNGKVGTMHEAMAALMDATKPSNVA